MIEAPLNNICPCGSGLQGFDCCLKYLKGSEVPETPEALMRSRYSAYVLQNEAYLLSSWADETRPGSLALEESVNWLGLKVLETSISGEKGEVIFKARFTQNGEFQQLEECSRFRKENERWLYVDGDASWQTIVPGRNESCPCGSGVKYKKCCLVN